jgi:hypothetical protein
VPVSRTPRPLLALSRISLASSTCEHTAMALHMTSYFRPVVVTEVELRRLLGDRMRLADDYAQGDFDNDHFSGSVAAGNAVVSTI